MRILWVAADRGAVGSYRCLIPAYSLRDFKVAESEFLFHENVTMSKPEAEMEGMDVVVFQRLVTEQSWVWMQTARRLGAKVIWEMDDDLFDVPRHNPAGQYWWQKTVQRQLRKQLDFCDRVFVSTLPLAQTVQTKMGWKTRDKIRVCPNHLHPAVFGKHLWYTTEQTDNQDKVVIGWQGSMTHDRDFREALPALRTLLTDCPDVLVRFFGAVPASVKGALPESRVQWMRGVQFEVYTSALRHAHFDIGVAPITNSSFNQSKSNIKYLEYSALEVPCVASRVYPYARTITDGVDGYLAGSTKEWYEKLRRLVDSPGLRREIGTIAFNHVWREHSYQTNYQPWAEALVELVGETHGEQLDTAELSGAARAGSSDPL